MPVQSAPDPPSNLSNSLNFFCKLCYGERCFVGSAQDLLELVTLTFPTTNLLRSDLFLSSQRGRSGDGMGSPQLNLQRKSFLSRLIGKASFRKHKPSIQEERMSPRKNLESILALTERISSTPGTGHRAGKCRLYSQGANRSATCLCPQHPSHPTLQTGLQFALQLTDFPILLPPPPEC